MVKQTKQTVLDEARLRANGKLYFCVALHEIYVAWMFLDSSVDPEIEIDETSTQKSGEISEQGM